MSRLQLFHGTVHDLVGDTLRPKMRSGGGLGTNYHKHHGQDRNKVVSATEEEDIAWRFAPLAGKSDRTRVYRVEPNSETRLGVEHPDHPVYQKAHAENAWAAPVDHREHVSSHFKVLERLDIKPGHQGTFPQVDWNRHASPAKGGYVRDENHPPPGSDDRQHRRALVDHWHHLNPGQENPHTEAWAARQAAKPQPQTETPGQLELHLGPQFRSTT